MRLTPRTLVWLLRRSLARAQHLFWEAAAILSIALPVLTVIFTYPVEAEAITNLAAAPADGRHFLLRWCWYLPIGNSTGWLLAALVLVPMMCRSITLVRAVLEARRLVASIVPIESTTAILQADCKRALRISGMTLWLAPGLGTPVTLGLLRPKILLPDGLEEQDVLRAALGHEMAHIARFDYARGLIRELMLLPLAFHPATRSLQRRLDQTCEMACDELAAAKVLESRRYARSLVTIAAFACGHPRASLAFGSTSGSDLQERVERLIGPTCPAKRCTIAATIVVLGGVAAFT